MKNLMLFSVLSIKSSGWNIKFDNKACEVLQNPQGLTKHEPLQNLEGFQNEHNAVSGLYRLTLFNLWLIVSLSASVVFGQQHSWVKIGDSGKTTSEIKLVSSSNTETVISFNLNAYELKPVKMNNIKSVIVNAPDAARILKTGAPDLPCFATSIIIPDENEMAVEVVNSNFIELNNISVAPSKGNLLRTVDPSTIPYTYGDEYQQNEFYPSKLSYLREPYIFRDYRGVAVVIQPFTYNPVTKVLRIYTEITLKVRTIKKEGINQFVRTNNNKIDNEYSNIYRSHFLNYQQTKYTPIDELPGNMLIISYPSFMAAMQPLVDWKILKGLPCEMVSVATIGNTATAIKNYVTNYYNTNGLTFLLLVGDFAQVTSAITTDGSDGAMDIDYAYISGSDHYPEFLVARFSAETVADVQTQVQRSVFYEKTPLAGTWYSKNLGIGSDQGPGDDGELDYEHIRAIQTALLGFTYDTSFELFDGSQGGLDAAGNPVPADVSTVVNPGVGVITYCGHGSDYSWGTTGFSNTEAAALLNVNKLPFIFSVACVVGHFNAGTCFCEAWMRAKQASGPTGAIGIFGSTINQSWSPPMEAEDEMIDILTETYASNIKRTYAGICENGCMKMNDTYSDFAMTDTWTIFGDPSLMVRTTDPMSMTVSHLPTLFAGLNTFQVNCDVEGAYVAITESNQILGTGYVSGGIANITLNPAPTSVGQIINVCVTAFNYVPYIGTFTVVNNTAPYVVYDSNVIHDSGVSVNGNVEYSENVSLDLTLKNVGSVDATNVTAILSTTNSDITITDNSGSYGNIVASTTSTQNNAFAFNVANVITDQQNATFTITSTDGSMNSWQSNFNIMLNAPVLQATTVTIDDVALGNGNGRLDPGETATINITTLNSGHAISPVANGTLTVNSGMVTVPVNNISIGTIAASSNVIASFNINVDAGATIGSYASFTYNADASGYTATKTFSVNIGLIVEDFESNTFTEFPWNMSLFGDAPWTILNNGNIYEGNFSARSGVIPNGTYTQDATSELNMQINVLTSDTLSFYKRVSSELDYDFLTFSVDGNQLGQWSGEVPWSREAYLMTTGNHNLKWVYSKDYMVTGIEDATYVDFIIFPPMDMPLNLSQTNNDIQYLTAYPNPTNSKSQIMFNIIKNTSVNLTLLNSVGQVVSVLIPNKTINKGTYNISLSNINLQSGIYYCKLTTDDCAKTIKIVVVK